VDCTYRLDLNEVKTMAYREFDPAAMQEYQAETVNLLTKQSEAIDQQIDVMANQVVALTAAMTAALLTAATLMKVIATKDGYIEVADGPGRAVAAAAAKVMETQINSLKGQIDSLKGEKGKIATAIQETNDMVNRIINQINELNYDKEYKMNELIGEIDLYKERMKTLYNRVGTTLVNFGYDQNEINQQDKFANTVTDFGDANIIKSVPFVPSSYIYKDGALNQKILYGIFKKEMADFNITINGNIKDASLPQFAELSDTVNRIAKSGNLDQLGRFVSAGYANSKVWMDMNENAQSINKNAAPQNLYSYSLSETFKNFAGFYSTGTSIKAISEVLAGSTVGNISEDTKLYLQVAGLLQGTLSQMNKLTGYVPNGISYPLYENLIKIQNMSFNKGNENAWQISGAFPYTVNSTHQGLGNAQNWYVTNYTNSLHELRENLKVLDAKVKKDEINFYYAGKIINTLLGMAGIPTDTKGSLNYIGKAFPENMQNPYKYMLSAGFTTKELIDYTNKVNAGISKAELESVLSLMPYGGVYILGRDHSVTASSTILDLNGGSGFGLGVEAYNYYNKDNTLYAPGIIAGGLVNPGAMFKFTEDYNHWTKNNLNDIRDYDKALCYAAEKLGTPLPTKGENITYQDYLNIINNLETSALIEEYFNKG